jgi:hypothetical protein
VARRCPTANVAPTVGKYTSVMYATRVTCRKVQVSMYIHYRLVYDVCVNIVQDYENIFRGVRAGKVCRCF